jgi:hypothetical protein
MGIQTPAESETYLLLKAVANHGKLQPTAGRLSASRDQSAKKGSMQDHYFDGNNKERL